MSDDYLFEYNSVKLQTSNMINFTSLNISLTNQATATNLDNLDISVKV